MERSAACRYVSLQSAAMGLSAALFLFLLSPAAHAATLFWRGTANNVDDHWESKANWSTLPRGPANASAAPGASDTAVFDFSGTTVRLRSNVSVGGLVMTNVWTGSLLQGTGTLIVGSSGIRMGSGTFVGGYGAGNGALNISAAAGFTMTGGIVKNLAGNFDNSGALSITSVNGSRPSFTLTGTLVMSGNASQNYTIGQNRVTAVVQNLTVNNNGSRVYATGSGVSLSGSLTISNGTLDLTRSSPAQTLVVKGGTTLAAKTTAGLISANNMTLSGSLTLGNGAVFTQTGGTVTFNGNQPQTITLDGAGANNRFNNVVFNNAGNAGTQNRIIVGGTGSVLAASGSLTVTAGTLDLMTNSMALAVKGGISANGTSVVKTASNVTMSGAMTIASGATWTETGGTLTFKGDNPEVVTVSSSNQRFNNVTVNMVSAPNAAQGKVTFAGNPVTVLGTATVMKGTWDLTTGVAQYFRGNIIVADASLAKFLSGGNITTSGSITVKPAGTFTQTGGTVYLDGTQQTLSGSMTFWTLEKDLTSSDTIFFYPGYTYTVPHSLMLGGNSSSVLLTMKSVIDGEQWFLTGPSKVSIPHTVLQDSYNNRITNQTCLDCTNHGNNVNWDFETSPSTGSSTSTTSTSTSSGGGGGGGGRSSAALLYGMQTSSESSSSSTSATSTSTASPQREQRIEIRIRDLQRRATVKQQEIDKAKTPGDKKALRDGLQLINFVISRLKARM